MPDAQDDHGFETALRVTCWRICGLGAKNPKLVKTVQNPNDGVWSAEVRVMTCNGDTCAISNLMVPLAPGSTLARPILPEAGPDTPGRSLPRVSSPYRYDVMPCSRTLNYSVPDGAAAAALGTASTVAPRPEMWAGSLQESIHHNMGTRAFIDHKSDSDHPWWAEAHAVQGRWREGKGASGHSDYLRGHRRPPQHHVRGKPCTAVERLNAVLAAAPR